MTPDRVSMWGRRVWRSGGYGARGVGGSTGSRGSGLATLALHAPDAGRPTPEHSRQRTWTTRCQAMVPASCSCGKRAETAPEKCRCWSPLQARFRQVLHGMDACASRNTSYTTHVSVGSISPPPPSKLQENDVPTVVASIRGDLSMPPAVTGIVGTHSSTVGT